MSHLMGPQGSPTLPQILEMSGPAVLATPHDASTALGMVRSLGVPDVAGAVMVMMKKSELEWNVENLVRAIRERSPNFHWDIIQKHLDSPHFRCPSLAALSILGKLLSVAGREISMEVMLEEPWRFPRGQLECLEVMLKNHVFFELIEAHFLRVLSMRSSSRYARNTIETMGAKIRPRNRQACASLARPWWSPAVIRCILVAAESSVELRGVAEKILTDPKKRIPDVLFSVLSLVKFAPDPTEKLHPTFVGDLLLLLLQGDDSTSPQRTPLPEIMALLMETNKEYLVFAFVCAHFRHSQPVVLKLYYSALVESDFLREVLASHHAPFLALDMANIHRMMNFHFDFTEWVLTKIHHRRGFAEAMLVWVMHQQTNDMVDQTIVATVDKVTQFFATSPLNIDTNRFLVNFRELLWKLKAGGAGAGQPGGAGQSGGAGPHNAMGFSGAGAVRASTGVQAPQGLGPKKQPMLGNHNGLHYSGGGGVGGPPGSQPQGPPPPGMGGMPPGVSGRTAAGRTHFPPEIQKDAKMKLRRLYESHYEVLEFAQELAKLRNSTLPRERELLSCIMDELFSQFDTYNDYPDNPLILTATLYGAIINHNLAEGEDMQHARELVLKALESKGRYFEFGQRALEQFDEELHKWPDFAHQISQLRSFSLIHPNLQKRVKSALMTTVSKQSRAELLSRMQEEMRCMMPLRLQQVVSESLQNLRKVVLQNPNNKEIQKDAAIKEAKIIAAPASKLIEAAVANKHPQQQHVAGSNKRVAALTIAMLMICELVVVDGAAHYATAVLAESLSKELARHPPSISSTINSITFFTLSHLLKVRTPPPAAMMQQHHNSFYLREMLLLTAEWLGRITLGASRPVLATILSPKRLIIDGYKDGRMLSNVLVVSRIMRGCVGSLVFHPHNPWVAGILTLLVEVLAIPNLIAPLAVEIKETFELLSISPKDFNPTPRDKPVPDRPTAIFHPKLSIFTPPPIRDFDQQGAAAAAAAGIHGGHSTGGGRPTFGAPGTDLSTSSGGVHGGHPGQQPVGAQPSQPPTPIRGGARPGPSMGTHSGTGAPGGSGGSLHPHHRRSRIPPERVFKAREVVHKFVARYLPEYLPSVLVTRDTAQLTDEGGGHSLVKVLQQAISKTVEALLPTMASCALTAADTAFTLCCMDFNGEESEIRSQSLVMAAGLVHASVNSTMDVEFSLRSIIQAALPQNRKSSFISNRLCCANLALVSTLVHTVCLSSARDFVMASLRLRRHAGPPGAGNPGGLGMAAPPQDPQRTHLAQQVSSNPNNVALKKRTYLRYSRIQPPAVKYPFQKPYLPAAAVVADAPQDKGLLREMGHLHQRLINEIKKSFRGDDVRLKSIAATHELRMVMQLKGILLAKLAARPVTTTRVASVLVQYLYTAQDVSLLALDVIISLLATLHAVLPDLPGHLVQFVRTLETKAMNKKVALPLLEERLLDAVSFSDALGDAIKTSDTSSPEFRQYLDFALAMLDRLLVSAPADSANSHKVGDFSRLLQILEKMAQGIPGAPGQPPQLQLQNSEVAEIRGLLESLPPAAHGKPTHPTCSYSARYTGLDRFIPDHLTRESPLAYLDATPLLLAELPRVQKVEFSASTHSWWLSGGLPQGTERFQCRAVLQMYIQGATRGVGVGGGSFLAAGSPGSSGSSPVAPHLLARALLTDPDTSGRCTTTLVKLAVEWTLGMLARNSHPAGKVGCPFDAIDAVVRMFADCCVGCPSGSPGVSGGKTPPTLSASESFSKLFIGVTEALIQDVSAIRYSLMNSRPYTRFIFSALQAVRCTPGLRESADCIMAVTVAAASCILRVGCVGCPEFSLGFLSVISHRHFMPVLLGGMEGLQVATGTANGRKSSLESVGEAESSSTSPAPTTIAAANNPNTPVTWPVYTRCLVELLTFMTPVLEGAPATVPVKLHTGIATLLRVIGADHGAYLTRHFFSLSNSLLPRSSAFLQNLLAVPGASSVEAALSAAGVEVKAVAVKTSTLEAQISLLLPIARSPLGCGALMDILAANQGDLQNRVLAALKSPGEGVAALLSSIQRWAESNTSSISNPKAHEGQVVMLLHAAIYSLMEQALQGASGKFESAVESLREPMLLMISKATAVAASSVGTASAAPSQLMASAVATAILRHLRAPDNLHSLLVLRVLQGIFSSGPPTSHLKQSLVLAIGERAIRQRKAAVPWSVWAFLRLLASDHSFGSYDVIKMLAHTEA